MFLRLRLVWPRTPTPGPLLSVPVVQLEEFTLIGDAAAPEPVANVDPVDGLLPSDILSVKSEPLDKHEVSASKGCIKDGVMKAEVTKARPILCK